MELLESYVERRGDQARLVGVIRPKRGEAEELHVSVRADQGHLLDDGADAFVPALLVPCMEAHEDLTLHPPVSPRLLAQLARAQDILTSWYPELRRVAVAARPREASAPGAAGTLALFSGGVDSFFTLLRSSRGPASAARPTHLLFTKGLEQPHEVLQGADESARRVDEVARETGTTLVVAETNFRDRFAVHYENCYFGAALASTALALTPAASTLLLPSSYSFGHLEPCGSHPLLDPLWSTERLEVVHHGAETSRSDKLAVLAEAWPESLPRLRVCLRNDGGAHNCGRCRKCVRTMVALDLMGLLERATSFPPRLPDDVLELLDGETEHWLEELQEFSQRMARTHRSARLVERALARKRRRRGAKLVLANTPVLAPAFARALAFRRRLRS